MNLPYDALLVVSFGGPEGMEDVMPFLQNVLRGRNIPEDRLKEVAHHYDLFGGVSPLNAQNRALIAALRSRVGAVGPNLPIYWGNRNWTPFLVDTLQQMKRDGIKRALAFFTSAYSSYSGCRQYREDIQKAQAAVGLGHPMWKSCGCSTTTRGSSGQPRKMCDGPGTRYLETQGIGSGCLHGPQPTQGYGGRLLL